MVRAKGTLANPILHGKVEWKDREGRSQDSGCWSPLDDVKEWIGLNSNKM